ncbi:MAG: hypothetical protein U1C33_02900, partial [Candidatus Cloacimonadaceae bacterium]|nr:hypothetical protein [Candidatus Cloacimonadaceae bacterium]
MKTMLFVVALIVILSPNGYLQGSGIDPSAFQQRLGLGVQHHSFIPRPVKAAMNRNEILVGYHHQYYIGDGTTHNWADDYKLELTYDENSRISSVKSKYWDPESISWLYESNYLISYNVYGRPGQVAIEAWNNGDWFLEGYINYSYVGNRITGIVYQLYIEGQLQNVKTMAFNYNVGNTILQDIVINFTEHAGVPMIPHKIQFAWDGYGRPSYITTYTYDDSNQWIVDERTQISYHPADNTNFQQYIDLLLFQVALDEYNIYPYGYYIMVDEEVSYFLSNTLWYPSNRVDYSYDVHTRVSQSQEFYYSLDDEEWLLEYQENYSYNEAGNMSEWLMSSYYEVLEPENRIIFIYEDESSLDENLSSPTMANLVVYPNPF